MGYSKEVYDRVWKILEERRQATRETAAARREEIHRRIPQVAAIEREMAQQAASITKVVIVSPHSAEEKINRLAEANLALQQQREQLLQQAGYPADYLAERPTCGACGDSGFVGQQMCSCMSALLRREAAARLGKISPVGSSTFAGFSLDYYGTEPDESGTSPKRRMEEVLRLCRRWAQTFTPQSESLLLIGRTGLGKTHLSVAMAGEVTAKGFGVVYTSVQRMMDLLEAEKFSREAARERYLETTATYLDCDLLVLDDLGTEFATQFVTATLFNILNTRLVEGRATVISTNLELREIEERYSQRMVSRLICSYRVLRFAGKDIRYQKKIAQGQ